MLELRHHVTKHMVIVRPLVFCDSEPVDGSRSHGRVRVFVQDLLKQPFRIWPLFFHDGDARQTHQELRGEIIFWKVTLNPVAFLSVFIKDDDGGRPHGFKTSKAGGILFNVNSERNEILFNE